MKKIFIHCTIFGSQAFSGFKDSVLNAIHRVSYLNNPELGPENTSVYRSSGNKSRHSIPNVDHHVSNSLIYCHNNNYITNAMERQLKEASIFDQSDIIIPKSGKLHRSQDLSIDSSNTTDSGQSMGFDYISQPMNRSYRADCWESGIVNGGETPIESVDSGEEENDQDRYHLYSSDESRNSISEDQLNEERNICIREFMKQFVSKIFENSNGISQAEKSLLGVYLQTSEGRLSFSRYINDQRIYWKEVSEGTFYSLVQYFAILLFECEEAHDFKPAKIIMNMCFTFYHVPRPVRNSVDRKERLYLYEFLTEQRIWRSQKFWNAAFSDAIHHEKTKSLSNEQLDLSRKSSDGKKEEDYLDENTFFGQLAAFIYYMREFGLPEKLLQQFLKKQAKIGNLSKDHYLILQQSYA
ncbi:uncharacterized protein KIAA0513 isoform X2 [Brevipalpus obovatus]|uniref:uncharacterized protein KIAA0513 isoform X2 n=1 Tax=Brevipalpus obovatus TaxID=246614 RepID=UPI003D9E3F56